MKSFLQNIVSIPTSINTLRIFPVISLLFLNLNSFGGNYTWNGGTSTSWTTTTNWTPNGNPSTNDTVKIKPGTFNCLLGANTTVKEFTLSSDTIDLGGNTLTVTNNLTTSTGFITNGTLTCNGTGTASLAGGTISVTLNITANSIQFSGGTYNNTVTAVKKGSGSSTGNGGCTFSGLVNLTDSGSGTWTLANSTSDTWNDKVTVTEASTGSILVSHHGSSNSFLKSVTFKNTSTGTIYCDYYGTSSFHDSLIVNSTGGGDISFGLGGGVTTLDTTVIVIGSSGFSSSGELYLGGIKQNDATKNISLTATSTAEIRFATGSIFEGKLTVTAPHLFLDGGRFLGVTTMTHNGTNTNSSIGSCYFGDSTLLIHNSTAGTFYIGVTKTDSFAAPVTIQNANAGKVGIIKAVFEDEATLLNQSSGTGTGAGTASTTTYLVADGGTCVFKDSLTISNSSTKVAFGTTNGSVTFGSGTDVNILSTYTGDLFLSNITQFSGTAINIPFQSNSGLLTLSKNNFSNPVTCNVKQAVVNGNTFRDSFYLKRTGNASDTWDGGNEFIGTATLIDSSGAHGFMLANINPDTYDNDVTIKNYSSGNIDLSYTGNSIFKRNITVDGSSAVSFGNNGGQVVLKGDSVQRISKTGSYNPSFKKLKINKTAGYFRLALPLEVSDSLIMTHGIIITDTTNILSMPDNGKATAGSDSSYVHGPMKKIGNDAFTYPLGDTILHTYSHHPITITAPSSTTDAFSSQYFASQQTFGSSADSTMENLSACEYWNLDRANGSSSVSVTLGWNHNSCNVFQLSKMKVAYWNGTKWLDKGNSATTGNTSIGTIKSSSAVSSFGHFSIADSVCTTLATSTSASTESCTGSSDGSASVTTSLGTSPYTYSWSPSGGTSSTASSLAVGTYTVTVTDHNGCVKIDSSIVALRTPITYTWTGSSSSTWSTSSNWTPTGVPITCDNVIITSTSHNPQLAANTVVAAFTINSGTLDLNSHSLTVTSRAHFNSGAINSGSVTVTNSDSAIFQGTQFGGYVSCTTNNVLLNGSTFNDSLTIIKKGSSNNISAGGNVFNGSVSIVDSGTGNLTLANSQSDDFNSSLKLVQASSGLIYPSGTMNTSIAGNITLIGSTALTFGNSGGKIIIDGSGNQSINQTGTFDVTVEKIEINKSAGAFTTSKPFTISDSLILIKGLINSDATNYITVSTGGIVIGATDSSFVNGPIYKVGDDDFIFPVGKNGKYRPIAMSGLTASSTFCGEYFANDPDSLYDVTQKDSTINNISRCEYWKLNRVAGSASAYVILTWDTNSCSLEDGNHQVARWNGSEWVNHENGEMMGNYVVGSVISNGLVTSFSPFTLSTNTASTTNGFIEKEYRGIYVNRLINLHDYPSPQGNNYLDVNYSILGLGTFDPISNLYSKEKELLEYCVQNHITYLVLYDLRDILGHSTQVHPNGETMADNLCRFMTSAKNNYFIEQFGAAITSLGSWNDVTNYNQTMITAVQLSTIEKVALGNNQAIISAVEDNNLPESDNLFSTAQAIRFSVLINRFNGQGPCPDFDICTTENEFYSECNYPTYRQLLEDLSHYTGIKVEAYVGYLDDCGFTVKQCVANELDGYDDSGYHKLIDRFLFTSYTAVDAFITNPFSNSVVYNKNDYISYHNGCTSCATCPDCTYHDGSTSCGDQVTEPGTLIHPLFSAESQRDEAQVNYQGYWMLQPYQIGTDPFISRNIFTVEKYYYTSWRSRLTSQGHSFNDSRENIIKPGVTHWFVSGVMPKYFKDPILFYQSDPPYGCASSDQTLQFTYCGPIEAGTDYIFTIKDGTGDVIVPRYGTVNDLEAGYPSNLQIISSEVLKVTLPVSATAYTASLTLKYKNHSDSPGYSGSYTYTQDVWVTNVPKMLVHGLDATNSACEGEFVILIPTVSGNVEWHGGGGIVASSQPYYVLKSSDVGNADYFYKISPMGDCSTDQSNTENITYYHNPVPCFTSICDPSTTDVTLSASSTYGSATFHWPDGSTNPTFTTDQTGETFLVRVTNEGGCTRDATMRIQSKPGPISGGGGCGPSWNLSVPVNSLFNHSTSLPPDLYWYRYDAPTNTWQDVSAPCTPNSLACTTKTVTSPGYYRFCVQQQYVQPTCSLNYCRNSEPVVVGGVAITNAEIVQPDCSSLNGAIDITVSTAGCSFSWSNGANTEDISGVAAGTYVVTIYDPVSTCTFVESFDLIRTLPLSVAITNNACYGGTSGSATVTTPGTSTYTYSWTPSGGSSNPATGLHAGEYSCTVSDASGCSNSIDATITEPLEYIATINYDLTNNVSCLGEHDGTAGVHVIGGTGAYTYAWSPAGGTGASAVGLYPNDYTVVVTDGNSCTTSVSVTISDPWGSCNEDENYCSSTGPIKTSLLSGFTPTNSIGIHSNLEVDNTFIIDANNVFIDPDISITVTGTGNLTIASASTLAPCSDMWKGIKVQTGGSLTIKGASTISGAEYAVNLEENATLILDDANFLDNYVGITNTVPFHPFPHYNFTMTGTDFSGSGTLPSCASCLHAIGEYPYAGILFKNINQNIGVGGTSVNHFSNLNIGIYLDNSIVSLRNCQFTDIHGDNFYTTSIKGCGIYDTASTPGWYRIMEWGLGILTGTPTFIDCDTAIRTSKVASRLVANKMEGVKVGISVIGCEAGMTANIDANNIECTRRGIEIVANPASYAIGMASNTVIVDDPPFSFGNCGIRVEEANLGVNGNYAIWSNDISIDNAQNGIELMNVANILVGNNSLEMTNIPRNLVGILQQGCDGSDIHCNEVVGGYSTFLGHFLTRSQDAYRTSLSQNSHIACNSSSNVRNGYVFLGPCSNTEYLGNDMINQFTGLFLSGSSVEIGPQPNTGNLWTGPFHAFYDAFNSGTPAASRFDVNTSTSGFIPSNPNVGSWFFTNMASNYSCPTCYPIKVKSGNSNQLTSTDRTIATHSFVAGGVIEDESRWISDKQLAEKLIRYPELDTEAVLIDFMDSISATSLAEFITVSDSIISAFYVDSANLADLVYNDSLIATYIESTAENDSLVASGSLSPEDSIELLASNGSYRATIQSLAEENKESMEDIQSNRNEKIDAIILQNDSISTSLDMEDNEKAINDIFLKTLAKNNFNFSSDQVETLSEIASQCPAVGGTSVYRARAMYHLIEPDVSFIDDSLCADTCIIPGIPEVYSGPSAGQCGQTGVSYSVYSVSGATSYSWEVSDPNYATYSGPTNLSSSSVNFADSLISVTLFVKANNSCGSSDYGGIVVYGGPVTPDTIEGSLSVCAYDIETYTTNSVIGATSYNWTVPSGATILTGSGTPSILLYWGTTGGDISVTASNDCDTSDTVVLSVDVTCRRANPNNIIASLKIFPNPTEGTVTIQFVSAEESDYRIDVEDVTGRILFQSLGSAKTGLNSTDFDFTRFSKGVYYINLRCENDNEVLKLIIQ